MIGRYAGRTLYRDKVGDIYWKIGAVGSLAVWLVFALGDYRWAVWGVLFTAVTWRIGHAGVWVGDRDVLIVHPVWGSRVVLWDEIKRFVVAPFNQWMIVWVVTRSGEEVPCIGISSGRKRTQRVDVVAENLNALVRARASQEGAVTNAAGHRG